MLNRNTIGLLKSPFVKFSAQTNPSPQLVPTAASYPPAPKLLDVITFVATLVSWFWN